MGPLDLIGKKILISQYLSHSLGIFFNLSAQSMAVFTTEASDQCDFFCRLNCWVPKKRILRIVEVKHEHCLLWLVVKPSCFAESSLPVLLTPPTGTVAVGWPPLPVNVFPKEHKQATTDGPLLLRVIH